MKINFYNSFLLFLPILFVVSSAEAEFRCRSDVRFKWQKKDDSTPQPNKGGTGKSAPQADNSTDQDKSIRDVFFKNVEAKGDTEDDTKNKLKDLVSEERALADSSCRELHENQTKCLALKYSQNASVIGMLSFLQRKDFEKKIIEDCEMSSGSCLGSAATEPICLEIKKADAQPSPEAGKGGKDAKKK